MRIQTQDKLMSGDTAASTVQQWKDAGKKVVFTNGCFDLLHLGHVRYLEEAAGLGDRLVIGVNSDASTRRLKGSHRPIHGAFARMYLLAALSCVDCVIEFDLPTPYELIKLLKPDLLVKGGDYRTDEIAGADIVLANGGKVLTIPFIEGYSTTSIESRIISTSREK